MTFPNGISLRRYGFLQNKNQNFSLHLCKDIKLFFTMSSLLFVDYCSFIWTLKDLTFGTFPFYLTLGALIILEDLTSFLVNVIRLFVLYVLIHSILTFDEEPDDVKRVTPPSFPVVTPPDTSTFQTFLSYFINLPI